MQQLLQIRLPIDTIYLGFVLECDVKKLKEVLSLVQEK